MHMLLGASLVALLAAGCLGGEPPAEAAASPDDDKASPTLTRTAAGLTITLGRTLQLREREGETYWVASGTSNYTLDDVFSYVADDAFARGVVTGDKTFELWLNRGHEANTLASGLRLYLSFSVVGQPATTPTVINGTLLFAPQLAQVNGHSKLTINKTVAPIAVGTELVYRGRVSATKTGTLSATAPTAWLPAISQRTSRSWNLDFTFDQWAQIAAADSTPLEVKLAQTSGVNWFKRARAALTVSSFALSTTSDPYNKWPSYVPCDEEVQACLDALPITQLDTESCGSYREVQRCVIRALVPGFSPSPDDLTAINAVIATANASLPAAGASTATALATGQWSDDAFFSLDQVMRGLDDYYDGVLVPGGALDQAALNATLAPPQLGGLVAAAKQAFYSEVYEAGLLYENIPGGLLKVVVLYFPEAARVLVVRIKAL